MDEMKLECNREVLKYKKRCKGLKKRIREMEKKMDFIKGAFQDGFGERR